MKILVTGATGFIGSQLVPALLKEHEVHCILNPKSKKKPPPEASLTSLDLFSPFGAADLPKDMDVIIHLAQGNLTFPEGANELFDINLASTQKLADYARRNHVSRFVFASTGNVYQLSTAPLSENSPTADNDFYAFTKLGAERLLSLYSQFFDICILRLFTPYGPGQTNRMIPKIIELVDRSEPVTLYNDGEPAVTPILIDDLIGIFLQSTNLQGFHIVNLGGPKAVTVKDLAEIIGKSLNRKPKFVEITIEKRWNLIAKIDLMKELFSVPQLASPEEGIARTIHAKNG